MILQDVATNEQYIGFAAMIWIIPMSTISLIILPKFVSFYRPSDVGTAGGRRGGNRNEVVFQVISRPALPMCNLGNEATFKVLGKVIALQPSFGIALAT